MSVDANSSTKVSTSQVLYCAYLFVFFSLVLLSFFKIILRLAQLYIVLNACFDITNSMFEKSIKPC